MVKKISELVEHVPLRFASIEHYIHSWQKLFYEEAKSQIYRSKIEESKEPYAVEIL